MIRKKKSGKPAGVHAIPGDSPERHFPIVGIGASAGGLAAFEAFFSAMPPEPGCGMAFVLVQHLAPDHKSLLTELVQRSTHMRVVEVADGMVVEPDCVYIIPPNRDMAFLNGSLQLLEPTIRRGMRMPIDFFFRSLAQDQRERAICIVLSGTGSDGTLGVRAVKGEGGMVMAQDPDTTEHDGMPRSAMATGLVDFVLPPAEMPIHLISYAQHAFGGVQGKLSSPLPKDEILLGKICAVLRSQTGHDFSQYKVNTLVRRVQRRMALHQIDRLDRYLLFLQKNLQETEALFRDLLIGVTHFFRDPAAFQTLETQIIPRLFSTKTAGEALRVWVCGCSTGEEAFSLAILLQEFLETLKQPIPVQVFATDIDRQAIEQARSGIYPASIVADVSPERLARFFTQEPNGGGYRVQKAIRDLLIFSEQDVIKDPPFSRLDLISCRNLLIYLNSSLQKRIIPLFHYSLKPSGVLFLGTSESIGEFGSLFSPLDRRWKIYQRQIASSSATRPALADFVPLLPDVGERHRPPVGVAPASGKAHFRAVTEQALLDHFAPMGVLIDDRGEILHLYGRTGNYLEPAPGDPGMNILSMAREGLRRKLTTALHRAKARNEPVTYRGIKVRTNGDAVFANLTVRPVHPGPGLPPEGPGRREADEGKPLFLVLLEEISPESASPPESADEGAGAGALVGEGQIAVLEQELRAKEEYLQTTLEEMETTNEELRSTNEEMQSVNEELQSTNEEMETSKEELQSVNEELATVNAELQAKVVDLSRANNDMNNLMAGTGIGTLFVDHQLRISRFTPATTQVINLIPTDVGRPVSHIATNLVGYDRLMQDVQAVLDTLSPLEVEVQTTAGATCLMRIQPYRTLENVIEGGVITFVDITERKRMEAALRQASLKETQGRLAEAVVASIPEPLVVLNESLQVVLANRAFYEHFRVTRKGTEGRRLIGLANGQWNIPTLRRRLEDVLRKDTSLDDFEVTHEFEQIGCRTMRLSARKISREGKESDLILLAIADRADGSKSPGKHVPGKRRPLTGSEKGKA